MLLCQLLHQVWILSQITIPNVHSLTMTFLPILVWHSMHLPFYRLPINDFFLLSLQQVISWPSHCKPNVSYQHSWHFIEDRCTRCVPAKHQCYYSKAEKNSAARVKRWTLNNKLSCYHLFFLCSQKQHVFFPFFFCWVRMHLKCALMHC